MCMPILKDPTPRYRLRYVTDDTVTWLLDKDAQDTTEKKRPLPLWLYVVSLAILIIGIAFLLTVIIFTVRRYIILNS